MADQVDLHLYHARRHVAALVHAWKRGDLVAARAHAREAAIDLDYTQAQLGDLLEQQLARQ